MLHDSWLTRLLDAAEPSYPESLRRPSVPLSTSIAPRPPPLFVRGTLPAHPLLAVVGTREPDPRSVAWTHALVAGLAGAGYAVSSGGAEGIDEAAHRAALALGVPTVAVTVGGLDLACTGRTAELFRSIVAAGGALVSLSPDGERVERRDFFRRNELLVALSRGVVAVELRPKPGQGGTGHTVRVASALGRPVMTVAHAPWTRGGPGAQALVRAGIPLVTGAVDVLEQLEAGLAQTEPANAAPSRGRRPRRRGGADALAPPGRGALVPEPSRCDLAAPAHPLSPDAEAAVAALGDGATALESVCAITGFDTPRAIRSLLEASLAGELIEITPGKYLRRRARPPVVSP